jgi:hypothetical protein
MLRGAPLQSSPRPKQSFEDKCIPKLELGNEGKREQRKRKIFI